MRRPPARALLLITRRGPAVRAWAPAVSSRTWLASEWNPLVRAWTSLIHEPTPGLRFPAPLSRLPGGVGRWATSSGARRCWILAGPRGSHPLFARFQGVPAAAANVRDLGNDSRQRPAATRGSEVWKLLGLVRPERGRLSGQSIVNRLRTSLFSSILRQEVAFFDKTRTGELINRLSSDTALLGRSVTENLSDGLRAGAQASVGVGMMFFVSPNLATFVLSVVPPISILAVIYGRYLRKLSKATQDSLAQATQLAEERIGNIRTIRAFGKETMEVEKYTSHVDQLLQLARKEALARAGFFGAAGLSGNLIVLSVLYKGGLLMGSAHMTVGELSSFLMYAFWVGLSIGGLSSFYSELMKGLGAGGRLWELLERQPQLPFNEGTVLDEKGFQGALEFRNVHFTYPARPEMAVFQDFSLSIPSGSVTALVGPSGSGKSTVVSLLLRLYDPVSGTVSLDGHDIRQLNPVWLRSKIGTVSQEPVLFSCSVAENIAYGADNPSSVTAQEVERAAEVANAAEFIRSFPQGFGTVVGEKGILLSGGQKQRIAIARALLKNPKILLLDEATSALDAENEHLVQEALDRLMEGRTVLIIAHRLSTIKNANFVAVLDQGKITEHGTHEELLLKPNGLYRKLMNKQSFMSV
ncbi:ATP-binding cassette sub-family B member 10, mitochondrial isoform X2 [Peromyscus californicus insignis]|uniref:ATP-binding cassette sub-family B member 10, mitochondrial isoform X2 n=1 Tax=Peromyscus californicus insignis TaxID=564181 RepID=UPI0022A7D394|nr:ATP-binding cassette sub-family B member 10, mitochondrial isoform X2 [Peromyscus californicus insignis]